MVEGETGVRFGRGQYVVARRGWVRTFVGDDPEPVHQQVPRCRVLDVIERPDGVHYRVRGWWVVPFRFVVSGDSIALCAHLFQEWIDKRHEVRLTVVGDRFFAVEIHAGSEAAKVDWRADYSSLSYKPAVVPKDVRRRVMAFMAHFGLVFGAFDFIVTPGGDWRFLEVNPNGQWSWIEHKTGVPISRAIADLLEKGDTV